MIRVFLADDHAIVRQGLKRILQAIPDMTVVGEAESGTEALRLLRAGATDVAILDIAMAGMTGLEVLEHLHAERPHIAVIILTMYDEEKLALRSLKLGASGYLSKKRAPEELIEAIRTASTGRVYVTRTLAEKMAMVLAKGGSEPTHEILSSREYQIMIRIARGMHLEEIAKELFLSPTTVSTYRARVLKKMGFENNIELTRYVVQEGLLD